MIAITSSRVIWSESGGCSPGGTVVVVVVVVVVGGRVVVVVVVGARVVVVVRGTVVVVVRGTVVVVGARVVVVVGGSVVVVVVVVGVARVVVVVVVVVSGRTWATLAASGGALGGGAPSGSLETTHIAPPARKTTRSSRSPRAWEVTTGKRYRPSYHCVMSRPPLVLASSSPRRRDLLTTLGLAFTSESPHVDESRHTGEAPTVFVERVARAKAGAVHRPGTATLGADTTVVLDDAILGKPASAEEAIRMLQALRGRTHLVHTGVAIVTDAGTWSGVTTTSVALVDLDDSLIDWYVTTGEPLDKAGSYAMQGIGGAFVTQVEGDPFNVIGLPLAATRALFMGAGLDLLAYRSP